MKSYTKGVITGLLIGAAVFAAPAIAENIDALFNQVRINVNGVDQIQWGEDIDFDNGETTPSSILYNGTTYLPMRKLGELSGQQIYWNGDSKTVAMTGRQKDINVVAEKEDANGNVWKYYTFNDDNNTYLGVKDETRGYERVYRMFNSSVRVTDNEIYFARLIQNEYGTKIIKGELIKLPFDNGGNTQDGEMIASLSIANYGVLFDDDYIFCLETVGGTSQHTELKAYTYLTSKQELDSSRGGTWSSYGNLSLVESDKDSAALEYTYSGSSGETRSERIIFDKTTNTFGNSATIKEDS